MEIRINAYVYCTEGLYGRLTCIIVNPTTREITHLVVKESFFGIERVAPLDMVQESTSHKVRLHTGMRELDQLPQLTLTEHLESQVSVSTNQYYLLWPYGTAFLPSASVVSVNVPVGELELHQWAHVEAIDGYVGHVSEFFFDVPTGHISHLVLEEGSFWNKKGVTIAISQVDRIEKDRIYLNLEKDEVAILPTISIPHSIRQ